MTKKIKIAEQREITIYWVDEDSTIAIEQDDGVLQDSQFICINPLLVDDFVEKLKAIRDGR